MKVARIKLKTHTFHLYVWNGSINVKDIDYDMNMLGSQIEWWRSQGYEVRIER